MQKQERSWRNKKMNEQIKKKPCGVEAARLDKQVIGHKALTDIEIITENKKLCKSFYLSLKKTAKFILSGGWDV